MKCENCGKNEVSFVYQSNINGKITEKHLCSECAEKLGYRQKLAQHSQQMMNGFFGGGLFGDRFFGDSLFGDVFAPAAGLMGRMGRLLDDPFDDFFSDMPALTAAPVREEEQKPEPKQDLVEKEEQSRFARMREINALKMAMKKAVRQENFEEAAKLRDQLHALEKDHGESK